MKDKSILRLIYLIQFTECNSDMGDYMVCENIEEVSDCVRLIENDLESNAISSIKISGIPLSKEDYEKLKNPDIDFELDGFYFNPKHEDHFEELIESHNKLQQ